MTASQLIPVSRGGTYVATVTAVATIGPLQGMANHTFVVTGLAAETLAFTLSNDGVTYGAAIKLIDLALQGASAAVTIGNGTYNLKTPAQYIQITKSAGANTVTVQWLSNFC